MGESPFHEKISSHFPGLEIITRDITNIIYPLFVILNDNRNIQFVKFFNIYIFQLSNNSIHFPFFYPPDNPILSI